MNTFSNIPLFMMKVLQSQNIKRNVVKYAETVNINVNTNDTPKNEEQTILSKHSSIISDIQDNNNY